MKVFLTKNLNLTCWSFGLENGECYSLIGASGDFSVPGHAGGVGFVLSTYSIGGDGANSFFGAGPGGSVVITTQITGVANAGTGYGSGASGSAVLNAAAKAGAAGYQGVIIITEYK